MLPRLVIVATVVGGAPVRAALEETTAGATADAPCNIGVATVLTFCMGDGRSCPPMTFFGPGSACPIALRIVGDAPPLCRVRTWLAGVTIFTAGLIF
jgi:hypothetical protein